MLALAALASLAGARAENHSPEIQAAASYVLEELQSISYSGIYESLKIQRIRSARTEKGVFHMNTFMTLELASPFLKVRGDKTKRKTATSTHEVIVMKHLDDGKLSFAIDEFPEMDEHAVEKFWIKFVETRRWSLNLHVSCKVSRLSCTRVVE